MSLSVSLDDAPADHKYGNITPPLAFEDMQVPKQLSLCHVQALQILN